MIISYSILTYPLSLRTLHEYINKTTISYVYYSQLLPDDVTEGLGAS